VTTEEQEEEDHDNDEVLQDADSDEEDEQANESANKKFPFAHRLLDEIGFQNNPLLENVLSSANEVSGLVQKQEGMGLSVGYQMAKVLKDEVTSLRLMVVSGTQARPRMVTGRRPTPACCRQCSKCSAASSLRTWSRASKSMVRLTRTPCLR